MYSNVVQTVITVTLLLIAARLYYSGESAPRYATLGEFAEARKLPERGSSSRLRATSCRIARRAEELAPRVRPAAELGDALLPERLVARVVVDDERAAPVAEEVAHMAAACHRPPQ